MVDFPPISPAVPVQQMFQAQAVAAPAGTQPDATAASQAPRPVDRHSATTDQIGKVPAQELRFFFISDTHSRTERLQDFIEIANREHPDLIVDVGDAVHDGTEPEIKRAYAMRQQLDAPIYMATGNHDANLRGPFHDPPPRIPAFQSFDAKGAHFILLDNEDETLSEEQFRQLEADLKANKGKPTFVAMHVPPKLSHEPLTVKLGKKLPMNFATPYMREPKQVERFHNLMKEYGVKAVLAGHTHFPDEVDQDGVRYITASSSGGLNPKPGMSKEFLEIRLAGNQLRVERRPLTPASNVVSYAAEAFDFYADLNSFNHQELGWNYFPSGNVSWQGGVRHVATGRGESVAPTAGVGFERIGPTGKGTAFGSLTISAAPQDIGTQLGLGYKHAVIGNYNQGMFLSGTVTGNAGYLQGQATAGVGIRAGVGAQYHNFTLELGQEWATNYSAQTLTGSYRF